MQLQNCLKYVLRGKRSTNPIRKKVHCVLCISAHTYIRFPNTEKKFWRRVRQIYDSHTVHYKKTPKSAKNIFVCFFQSLSSLISVESYFIFKAIYFCTILTIIQRTVHPKGVCVGGESNLQTKPICLLIINLKWTTRFFTGKTGLCCFIFCCNNPKFGTFFMNHPLIEVLRLDEWLDINHFRKLAYIVHAYFFVLACLCT